MLKLLIAAMVLSGGDMPTIHIRVQGLDRHFMVYVPITPARVSASKMPLLLVLHGRLGTPSGTVHLADFRPIADREGVILVYPAGINRSWNDGREGTPANKKGVDDVAFIDQLITYMTHHYAVDTTRIYVTGMSNGGFMTSRLGCSLTQRIAAIAVVAASISRADPCSPALPLPVLYIQGTKDPLVPFEGGEMKKGAGGTIDSHRQALDHWVAIDGCDSRPQITHLPDSVGDGTTITREVYSNPATGVLVEGITVTGGGHTWPGGWAYLPAGMVGITSRNLDANEAIWAFFRQFSRTASPN